MTTQAATIANTSIPVLVVFYLEDALNHVLALGGNSCSIELVSVASYGECLTVAINGNGLNTVKLSQYLQVSVRLLNERTDIGSWSTDLEVLEYVADWEKGLIEAKLIY